MKSRAAPGRAGADAHPYVGGGSFRLFQGENQCLPVCWLR